MSISGGEETGLSVSNLNLPAVLRPGDFGGLTFGLFINNPDLTATYDLSAQVTSITPFGTVLDSDNDGVPDDVDSCPGTAAGAIVDGLGCSLEQLVPCTGPWKNHGQYLVALTQTARSFYLAGRITAAQLDALHRAAAYSPCGKH